MVFECGFETSEMRRWTEPLEAGGEENWERTPASFRARKGPGGRRARPPLSFTPNLQSRHAPVTYGGV